VAGVRAESGGVFHPSETDGGLFLAVCDGMGGAKAGEVASSLAADTMFASLNELTLPLDDPEVTLRSSLEEANRVLLTRSNQDEACRGMGTTLTGVLILDGLGCLGHVGDSRAYLHHEGVLRQLTRDHSLVNFLIDYGVMSSDQAEALVNRNIILEALGVKETVSVDTGAVAVERGDLLLLCTDGLTATLEHDDLVEIVNQEPALEPLTARLIEEANRRGGPDNITVLACRVS